MCCDVGDMTLCDELGGVYGTAVGIVDVVEGGVQLGVVGGMEDVRWLVLGTCDGLL